MVSAASAISLATGRSIDLLVTPYQDVELPPIVGLAENDPDSRWAVELTPDGARALGEALRDVADLVDPQA